MESVSFESRFYTLSLLVVDFDCQMPSRDAAVHIGQLTMYAVSASFG
jgi:hypothetical protein